MSSQSYVLPSPLRDQKEGGAEDLSAESIFASCRRRYSMTSEKSSAGGSTSGARVVSPSSISISSLRTSSRTSNRGVAAAPSTFRFPVSTSASANNDSSQRTLDLASSIVSSPPASTTSGPVIGRRASSLALSNRSRAASQSISSSGSSSHHVNRYGQSISTPPSTTPSLSLSHSRTASRSDRSDVDTIASSAGFSPLGRPLRQYFPSENNTDTQSDDRRNVDKGKWKVEEEECHSDLLNPDDSFLPSSNDGKVVTEKVQPHIRKKTISFQQRASRNPDKVAHLLGEEYYQSRRDTLQGRFESHSTINLPSSVIGKGGIRNLFSSIRSKSKREDVSHPANIETSWEEKIFRFGHLSARRSETSLPTLKPNIRYTLPNHWQGRKNPTIEEDSLDDVFIISKQRNSFNATNIEEARLHSLSVLDESTKEDGIREDTSRVGSSQVSLNRGLRESTSRGERLSWLISTDDSFLHLDSESKTASYHSDDSNPPLLTSRNATKGPQRPLTSSSSYSDHDSHQLKRSHSIDALYAMLEPWAVENDINRDHHQSVFDSSSHVRRSTPVERKTPPRRQVIEKSLPALPEVPTADEERGESILEDNLQAHLSSSAKERGREMDDSIAAWCMDFNMYPSNGSANRRQGRNLEHIHTFSSEDEDANDSQLDALPNALDTILHTLKAKMAYIARVHSKPFSCKIVEQRQCDEYMQIRPNASMHLCALAALQSGLSFEDDEDQVMQFLGLESQRYQASLNSAIAVGCGIKEVGKASRGTEGWVLTVVGNAQDSLLGSASTSTYLMKFANLLAPLLLAQDYQEIPIEVARPSRRHSITEQSSPSSSVFVTPRSSPVRVGTESPTTSRRTASRRATMSSNSSHGSFNGKKLPPLASPPPTSPLPLLPESASLLQLQQNRRPLSPPSIVTPPRQGYNRGTLQQSPL